MDAFSGFPSSADDVLAIASQMPFLGLPVMAHLSEALNRLKPDVAPGGNPHWKELALSHHFKCSSTTRSKELNRLIIEDNSFENCDGDALAVGNLEREPPFLYSRSALVVEQVMASIPRIGSTAAAVKCVSFGMACPPKQAVPASTKLESKNTSGFTAFIRLERDTVSDPLSTTESLWQYGFSMEPVPNVVSSGERSQRKGTKLSLHLAFHAGANQPSKSCKITLRKLHLRCPLMEVKSTTSEMMNGKPGTKERKTENDNGSSNGHLQSVHVLKQLLCGGVAGVTSRTMVAPLDLVKTYLITSHGLGGSQKSALGVFKEIVDSTGWQGLFRGNLINCIRVAPNKAIELCVFEAIRRELNKEDHPLKNMAAAIAGGAAGMASTAATYPLELIRTRLSVQPELYKGVLQATAKIFQEEGFIALYSGLSPSLVGIFPYAATNYFLYDGLRTTYQRSTGMPNVPTIPTLAFGAVAAAVSSMVTYPLEVARKQMQLCLTNSVKKSSVGIILDIYRHEGFLALYRGLGTTWLKLIPAAGISFMCYEGARLALCIDDASIAVKAKEGACISADEES